MVSSSPAPRLPRPAAHLGIPRRRRAISSHMPGCYMTPFVNSLFYLDFLPLKLHIPIHFPFTTSQVLCATLSAGLMIPLPSPPHPCRTSRETAPGALSAPPPSPTLPVRVYSRLLLRGGEYLLMCIPASPFRRNGSHSGCTIKSTREILKVKPIIISWKGTHKTPKLRK